MGLISGGILSLLFPELRFFYAVSLAIYLSVILISSLNKDIRLIPRIFLGTILTHLSYGFWFIKGLLSKKMQEEILNG